VIRIDKEEYIEQNDLVEELEEDKLLVNRSA